MSIQQLEKELDHVSNMLNRSIEMIKYYTFVNLYKHAEEYEEKANTLISIQRRLLKELDREVNCMEFKRTKAELKLQQLIDDEIKPCPFCRDIAQETIGSYPTRYVISCQAKGCVMRTQEHKTKKAAIAAWNKRVPK